MSQNDFGNKSQDAAIVLLKLDNLLVTLLPKTPDRTQSKVADSLLMLESA